MELELHQKVGVRFQGKVILTAELVNLLEALIARVTVPRRNNKPPYANSRNETKAS